MVVNVLFIFIFYSYRVIWQYQTWASQRHGMCVARSIVAQLVLVVAYRQRCVCVSRWSVLSRWGMFDTWPKTERESGYMCWASTNDVSHNAPVTGITKVRYCHRKWLMRAPLWLTARAHRNSHMCARLYRSAWCEYIYDIGTRISSPPPPLPKITHSLIKHIITHSDGQQ